MITLANTITADMGLIPGLAFVGPAMGLPLSVMAAFIERPFYSLAGIRHKTIWYSLQANLVSLAVGFFATFIAAALTDAMREYDALFEVWPFLAVCVSIIVERIYLQRRNRSTRVAWSWTAAGNILSAAICVGLLFLIAEMRPALPQLRRTLAPFNAGLQGFALIASGGLFLLSFLFTRIPSPPDAAPRLN